MEMDSCFEFLIKKRAAPISLGRSDANLIVFIVSCRSSVKWEELILWPHVRMQILCWGEPAFMWISLNVDDIFSSKHFLVVTKPSVSIMDVHHEKIWLCQIWSFEAVGLLFLIPMSGNVRVQLLEIDPVVSRRRRSCLLFCHVITVNWPEASH